MHTTLRQTESFTKAPSVTDVFFPTIEVLMRVKHNEQKEAIKGLCTSSKIYCCLLLLIQSFLMMEHIRSSQSMSLAVDDECMDEKIITSLKSDLKSFCGFFN